VVDRPVLNGSRESLLVYFATTRYDGPAGTDRHMADQLSRQGPVLFVEPPQSPFTRFTRPDVAAPAREPALRQVTEQLALLTPRALPGATRPGLYRFTAPAMRHAVRAAVARLYPADSAGVPVRGIVSCRVDPVWSSVPARRRVQYVTDDVLAGARLLRLPPARLAAQEAAAVAGADAVAVVSPPLGERLAAGGRRAELIPNGCDPDAYAAVDEAARPPDAPQSGPVAGFVGHINDRIDLAYLEAVADTGTTVLLVGPRSGMTEDARFDDLVRRPGVRWVGPKPFTALPGYLRVIDVGLTPYADTAFNRASFPLKTLEYLAAGRPVVSTPLPANDWLASDLVHVAAGPEEFARRVLELLGSPRTPAAVARRQAFARTHSWAHRAAALGALVDGGAERGARSVATSG
jgi:teichuronic acid biosynthesis glycosyltransferase TuaH